MVALRLPRKRHAEVLPDGIEAEERSRDAVEVCRAPRPA